MADGGKVKEHAALAALKIDVATTTKRVRVEIIFQRDSSSVVGDLGEHQIPARKYR